MSFGPWWRYVKFREKWNFLSPRKLILKLRGKLWEFLSEKSGGCNNTEGISWHILFYFLRIHIHLVADFSLCFPSVCNLCAKLTIGFHTKANSFGCNKIFRAKIISEHPVEWTFSNFCLSYFSLTWISGDCSKTWALITFLFCDYAWTRLCRQFQ